MNLVVVRLLLALHSRITPDSAQRTIWHARDQTWVGRMQTTALSIALSLQPQVSKSYLHQSFSSEHQALASVTISSWKYNKHLETGKLKKDSKCAPSVGFPIRTNDAALTGKLLPTLSLAPALARLTILALHTPLALSRLIM